MSKPTAKSLSPPQITLDAQDDARMIIIGAFRYYLGRMTISVWAFGKWLEERWPLLDEGTRRIIERELEEAFKWDDEQRSAGGALARLGHDCDRATWSRVRALYRTPRCTLCGIELPNGTRRNVHIDGEHSCLKCAPPKCEVCDKPFKLGETIVPNNKTRRYRHPGCSERAHA